MPEAQVQPLGWEDPLEEGMAAHSSFPAWRISWTEEPVTLWAIGLYRVGYYWSTLACVQGVENEGMIMVSHALE